MPKEATDSGKLLTRGELAGLTGCNIETIRYYEKIGLMAAPLRSGAGHRLYGQEPVKRVTFIRRSRELGFSLEEIRALLRLVDGQNYTCAQIEALARAHVSELERKIADLKTLKGVLETMVAQCTGGAAPECAVVDALFDARRRQPRRNKRS